MHHHYYTEVYICGINTDYCVLATALDAFNRGLKPVVVADAVTSVDGRAAHEVGRCYRGWASLTLA